MGVHPVAARAAAGRNESVLLCSGGFLDDALRSQRVTHGEVRQAARSQGHASLDAAQALVLETDGTFSILTSALASDQL